MGRALYGGREGPRRWRSAVGSAMAEPRSLQAECCFRPGPHRVRLGLAPSSLEVEVEAQSTADRWRGEFDAAAIEELTRKTGNFKQFGIFCAMLEAALLQSSDAVSLELLTYKDLELLRSRKAGMSARAPPPAAAGSPLSARRYLILGIHYPLPLPYVGRPDPAALRRQLRELQQELERLRAQRRPDPRDAEIQRLREQLQRAVEEKRRCQDELQRRHRELLAQLEEAKASEQRLKLRVRSLTAELASSRRGHRTPSAPGSRERPPPSRSPSPAAPPRFDPTAFVRARQRRQQQLQPHNQRRGAGVSSSSPARSRGRSSSAESCRSRRSVLSSGSGAEDPPQRPRRTPHGRRPLSTLTCNGASAGQRVASCKAPTTKRSSKENQHETELAEIDARLQALQEVMARMLPPGSQWEPPGTHM
ncbi:centrosomal protein CCDC61 isoform X2 [Lathamus discolor]|uniref:centrosomal protein CCDC61 isoform X2 n=1 Tax=Lathamus discolor TaxID=678569 RepID=UPI0032B81675